MPYLTELLYNFLCLLQAGGGGMFGVCMKGSLDVQFSWVFTDEVIQLVMNWR